MHERSRPALENIRTLARLFREKHAYRRLKRQVTAILCQNSPPDITRSQVCFEKLQSAALFKPPYGYDDKSLWERAMKRLLHLLHLPGAATHPKTFVELGAGDCMLAYLLTQYGHKVIALDAADWRHPLAGGIQLLIHDISKGLPLADMSADYVISYNTFEHLPDPQCSLNESLRILRPAGCIHLDFAPVYTGPWGLHAYSVFKMPYPQFLFSSEFIAQQIASTGVHDLGRQRTEPQYVNRWRLSQYERMWRTGQFDVLKYHHSPDSSHLQWVLDFPECFTGRELTYQDITACHIMVTLQKKAL